MVKYPELPGNWFFRSHISSHKSKFIIRVDTPKTVDKYAPWQDEEVVLANYSTVETARLAVQEAINRLARRVAIYEEAQNWIL